MTHCHNPTFPICSQPAANPGSFGHPSYQGAPSPRTAPQRVFGVRQFSQGPVADALGNGKPSPRIPQNLGLMGPGAVQSAPNGAPSFPDSSPAPLMAPQKRCQKQGRLLACLTGDDLLGLLGLPVRRGRKAGRSGLDQADLTAFIHRVEHSADTGERAFPAPSIQGTS